MPLLPPTTPAIPKSCHLPLLPHTSAATIHTRPGRRIVDDNRLQRLLQPSEIVVKKSFWWLDLKKIGNSR